MPDNDYDNDEYNEHDEERHITLTVIAKWDGKEYTKRFKFDGIIYRFSDETFENPITGRVYKASDYNLNTKIYFKLYGDIHQPSNEEPMPAWKKFELHKKVNNWPNLHSEKILNPIMGAPMIEEGAELVHAHGILLLRRPAEMLSPFSTPEMVYRPLQLSEQVVLQDSFEFKGIRRGRIVLVDFPEQKPYRATIIAVNQISPTVVLFVTILNQHGNEQQVYRAYIKEDS